MANKQMSFYGNEDFKTEVENLATNGKSQNYVWDKIITLGLKEYKKGLKKG